MEWVTDSVIQTGLAGLHRTRLLKCMYRRKVVSMQIHMATCLPACQPASRPAPHQHNATIPPCPRMDGVVPLTGRWKMWSDPTIGLRRIGTNIATTAALLPRPLRPWYLAPKYCSPLVFAIRPASALAIRVRMDGEGMAFDLHTGRSLQIRGGKGRKRGG
jgi:hypothetical protein